MKLLSKYNRVNIIVTVIVLLMSAVLYYFFVEAALVHQLDKNLVAEEKEITDYIKENNQLPEPTYSKDEQESYLAGNEKTIERKFSTVTEYHKKHDKNVLYRQLEFQVTVAGKPYIANVKKSQEETEDVVKLILQITLAMVLLLLIALFLINRFVLGKLWKPFNSTLQQIKLFNISAKENVSLESTEINEFKELNMAVSQMTKKARNDYNEIKTFTENASHEIQTPLAIINSKVELLSQGESLKEDQMNLIQSISETTKRLSKLNQSLLLLTKLENRQFSETEKIDFGILMSRHLGNYEELLAAKEIKLTKTIDQYVKLIMNETLADILITNLLTNAIKHNITGGFIKIELHKDYLAISNSGRNLSGDPGIFFERFKKDSIATDSLGLGLSIVKKISEIYGFETTYSTENKIHTISVHFDNSANK